MKCSIGIFFASISILFCSCQSASLQQRVEEIAASKQATVGVAIISNDDTVLVNNEYRYPMQSVYKFHLALAILNMVDSGKLSLEQNIYMSKTDLLPNTYSPLREKYPEGNVSITLKEILQYTVSQSDNNGCDILFRLAGGTKKVNDYIRSIGIDSVSIAATEEEMHVSWKEQYHNWTTPLAAAHLLEKFYRGEILSKSSQAFLWQTMTETTTGENRIKGLLSQDVIVAHKTGSGVKYNGIISACNDIGIVQLPNGKYFTVVVLVANSKESEEANERIIAKVAKVAWDYFVKKIDHTLNKK